MRSSSALLLYSAISPPTCYIQTLYPEIYFFGTSRSFSHFKSAQPPVHVTVHLETGHRQHLEDSTMSAAAVVVGAALAGSPAEPHATPFHSLSQDENSTRSGEGLSSDHRVSFYRPLFPASMLRDRHTRGFYPGGCWSSSVVSQCFS